MSDNDRFLPQVVLNNFVTSTASHSIFSLTCKTTRLFIKTELLSVRWRKWKTGKSECAILI